MNRERPLVLEDQGAHLGVVFPKHPHDLLGLGRLGEGGETAEVEEDNRHFLAVRLQGILGASRHDQLSELWREEALEPPEPLELPALLLDTALELLRPLALGDVLHGAEHAPGSARITRHQIALTMDKSHLAVGPDHSVLHIVALPTSKRLRHCVGNDLPIFGVNQFRQLS